MTKKEALIAELDEVEVSDGTLEKTLLDRVADPAEVYSGSDAEKKEIDLCVIDILFRLYTRADISEGGFSKSHPDFLRKIEKRLIHLATRHEVTEVLNQLRPTVKGVSPW